MLKVIVARRRRIAPMHGCGGEGLRCLVNAARRVEGTIWWMGR
jgi:hypothetical protein